jgi:hypothetical protein
VGKLFLINYERLHKKFINSRNFKIKGIILKLRLLKILRYCVIPKGKKLPVNCQFFQFFQFLRLLRSNFHMLKNEKCDFDLSNHKNWKINWKFLPFGHAKVNFFKRVKTFNFMVRRNFQTIPSKNHE